jgi:hypothetical protein
MRQMEQTYFSCVEFDGHLSGIGIAIEDGDYDLLIGLIEFMSVGGKNWWVKVRRCVSRHYLRLAVMAVENQL